MIDLRGLTTSRPYVKTGTTVCETNSLCSLVAIAGALGPKAVGAFKFKVTPFLFARCRHIEGSLAVDEKPNAFSWLPLREQYASSLRSNQLVCTAGSATFELKHV